MKKLIRVTQIEKFRRFLSGRYDFETEQQVVDTITSAFQGNAYTHIGTAFHRIVEQGDKTEGATVAGAGVRKFLYYGKEAEEPVPVGRRFIIDDAEVCLDVAQCKVALEYRNTYPNAFHEVREFLDFGDFVLTGCADMIDGFEIRDIKTKYSAPHDEDYTDSCQWRYYCEMFGADTFHFDLFVFVDYKLEKHGTDVRGLQLIPYTPPITCHYYNGMEEDNRVLLKEFTKWAKFRGVYDELPDYTQETINNLH